MTTRELYEALGRRLTNKPECANHKVTIDLTELQARRLADCEASYGEPGCYEIELTPAEMSRISCTSMQATSDEVLG